MPHRQLDGSFLCH
uniref:Uncharacterized protein n=1 Tax=Arundo donax TaxID=35708 RepID=A0A0A9HCQ6_ARUDO